MTKLTLAVPSVGEKNTVAEPKVDTALKAIEMWANGEVGTGNIEAKTITEAMLATAVQEKLSGTIFGLTVKKENASVEAKNGELVVEEKAASTVTLPAATANRTIGVYCTASSCKVKASAGKIFGDFLAAAGETEVTLSENQHILVEATGSNWLIIAGEPKGRYAKGTGEATWVGGTNESGVTTVSHGLASAPSFVSIQNTNKAGTDQPVVYIVFGITATQFEVKGYGNGTTALAGTFSWFAVI